ncbi:A-kinase anchor protein 12 isoform 2 [Silurus asotus]|uniref:A-kinase anchor protein 12 isoform 2 n=1 Tax=Silurus asotus TaxID=30991 RepID=A0AAD5AFR7_SILAS|nr:A-kinase anchor protein 12 isoform 2 [Silurus asotus]
MGEKNVQANDRSPSSPRRKIAEAQKRKLQAEVELGDPNLLQHDNVPVHKASAVKILGWNGRSPALELLNTFGMNVNADCNLRSPQPQPLNLHLPRRTKIINSMNFLSSWCYRSSSVGSDHTDQPSLLTCIIGQTEAMPQKEDSPESIEVLQEEVSPQVNGEQEKIECVTEDPTTPAEEKVAEEKPTETNEVGFKKIFRFVGFKFTLKKDKNEKVEPVQLLTVKETEDGASEAAVEETKEEPVTAEIQSEDEKKPDAPEIEKNASEEDAEKTETEPALPATDTPTEPKSDGTEETEKTPADEPAEEVETSAEKEKEPEAQAESPTSPPSQETQSPFRRFFTQGIFSNLRKKTSFKKSKEEETIKEKSADDDIKEADETKEAAAEEEGQIKEDTEKVETDEQVDKTDGPEKSEESPEEAPSAPEEKKEEELKEEVETLSEVAPVQEPEAKFEQIEPCEISETSGTEDDKTKPTDDAKLADKKAADSSEEQQTSEKSPVETPTEGEVQSSQDKAKPQGSPLKKLFTGAGLKKLSSKKQKGKKETDSKPTESTEQTAEQIQSSTESGEAQKPDSGASSPEESGEHVVGEASQAEASAEAEGEGATSDTEKKKDSILQWASFKKLVTPKKRVKRSSESEDETTGDKAKSATLSSTESAVFEEKTEEIKPSEEGKEETKEESQVEGKTEVKAEKVEQSTEETKKKIDTSVSWEALICVGSSKKRARKNSDSDEEEPKIEEEVQQSGEEQVKTAESPLESSQEVDHENLASSPEPEGELVSTWESFKRLVTQRKKPKAEEKSDEAQGPEQATSDSELPKEESSFSLRKLIPRRKKKSDTKQGQVSSDVGSAEEDSDTPAVVPLSEYDTEQSEKATAEETKTEEAKKEVTPVTPVTPGKASAEDRSPSWISTTVENVEDETEGKPLSDIPEEGDTAVTPKSTDNTIAEDIVEFTSEAITAIEPAEETEMVSALSRITESPVTSGEASPVPDDGVVMKTEAVLQEAVETITITSSKVAVTVTEEQTHSMVVTSSPFPFESATKEEKVVLAVHEKSEATSICIGLDASEIKAVEEESPLKTTVEAITLVSEALSVEVAAEDQTLKAEEAEVAEDKVSVARVNEVQTEFKEQPLASEESTVELVQTSIEFQEAAEVKLPVVTTIQQEIEILEEPIVAENTSKVVAESPVESAIEQPVCAQTVEITEIAAAEEEVQELKDVKESVACTEVESVEVAVAVSEEVATSLADTIVVETTMSHEELIPVLAATEEFAVTEEVVGVCPPTESETKAEVKDEVVIESVLPSEVHVIKNVEIVTASVSVEENIEVTSSVVSTVIEEACEKDEEEVKAKHLKETIQEQSTVIVQEVLQNVVENLSELQQLEEKPVEEIHTAKPEEVLSAPEEEKSSQDAPVTEDKSSVHAQIQEELKCENKAEEEPTKIVTESLPVSEAIQVSEVVLVAMTEEIKEAREEKVSSYSVEATQACTDAEKHEVELKECEKVVEEDKSATTESEEVKCQVKKEEPSGATESPASDESSEMQSTTHASTKHVQIVEEESQQVQDVKIETTTEIKVSIVHEVDADKRASQDIEIAIKEDSTKSQESSNDVPQSDLEEEQKSVSAPHIKGQEESGDPDSQMTDAEAAEVQPAVGEAPKEKDVEKAIDTVTTETTTDS